jgi:hypothetical protein
MPDQLTVPETEILQVQTKMVLPEMHSIFY